MKKKTLFLALIGILTTPLLLIPKELPAQTYHQDDLALKEEPSDEIKQLYKELKSKISQLETEIELPVGLKDAQKEIKEISLELKGIQPTTEAETAENRVEIKLNPASRALIDKKRALQTKLHIAGVPLELLKNNLAELSKQKKELEAEYFLVPVETLILAETASELKGPIIIIEGELELRRPDEINITLALNRSVAASAFCEVYLNNTFIKRERWKIGPEGEFTTAITASDGADARRGPNSLAIIFNTSCQEDDVVLEAPSFEGNPLAISNQSKIAARNLISGSFKLKGEEIPIEEQSDESAEDQTPVEAKPQPPTEDKAGGEEKAGLGES